MSVLVLWLAQQPAQPGLTWPQVAGGLAAVVTTGAIVLGGLAWWVRAVVRRESAPVRQQVTGTNGATLASTVEHTRDRVDEIAGRVELVATVAAENRAIARGAQALAEHTASRLDGHLVSHGKEP